MSKNLNIAFAANGNESQLLRSLKTAVLLGDTVTLYSVEGILRYLCTSLGQVCEKIAEQNRFLAQRYPDIDWGPTSHPTLPQDALELFHAVETGIVRIPESLLDVEQLESFANDHNGDSLFEHILSLYPTDTDDFERRIEVARILHATELLRQDVCKPSTYPMINLTQQVSSPGSPPHKAMVGAIAVQAAHSLLEGMDFVELSTIAELADIRQTLHKVKGSGLQITENMISSLESVFCRPDPSICGPLYVA